MEDCDEFGTEDTDLDLPDLTPTEADRIVAQALGLPLPEGEGGDGPEAGGGGGHGDGHGAGPPPDLIGSDLGNLGPDEIAGVVVWMDDLLTRWGLLAPPDEPRPGGDRRGSTPVVAVCWPLHARALWLAHQARRALDEARQASPSATLAWALQVLRPGDGVAWAMAQATEPCAGPGGHVDEPHARAWRRSAEVVGAVLIARDEWGDAAAAAWASIHKAATEGGDEDFEDGDLEDEDLEDEDLEDGSGGGDEVPGS